MLTVAQATDGAVIQILTRGCDGWVGTDRICKVGRADPATGRRVAWERFTQNRIMLHPTVPCRDVSDSIDRPDWRI